MSERDQALGRQPGRSTLLRRFMSFEYDEDGLPALVDAFALPPVKRTKNIPQKATNSVARVTKSLSENGSVRASLPAVPAKTRKPAATAKQRHMRTSAYNLRRLRKARGWLQEELATLIGVRREQVVHWESGKDYEPGADNLEKLCNVFEVDEREFRTPIPELEPDPA